MMVETLCAVHCTEPCPLLLPRLLDHLTLAYATAPSIQCNHLLLKNRLLKIGSRWPQLPKDGFLVQNVFLFEGKLKRNTTDPPSKQKKIFFVTFCHYLLNEI